MVSIILWQENDVNYDHRFQRTGQWLPVYTWLESIKDADEVVNSKDILDWLSANPDVNDDLHSRHSRGHLVHYIKQCHLKILRRMERKKVYVNFYYTILCSKIQRYIYCLGFYSFCTIGSLNIRVNCLYVGCIICVLSSDRFMVSQVIIASNKCICPCSVTNDFN